MPNRFILEKDERAIISGFHTETAALKAKEALERLGVIDIKINQTDYQSFTGNELSRENALTGDFPGLASSVYDTEFSKDLSILLSTSPDASGLTDRAADNIGIDVVLTVVLDHSKLDQAEQILKKYGARI